MLGGRRLSSSDLAAIDAHPPSIHSLAWASLRKDQLCEGLRECLDVCTVTCTACSTTWTPPDIRMPDACPNPSCGAERKYKRERCSGCTVRVLERALQCRAGKLLFHAVEIDSMLQCPGMSISPDSLDAVEWQALQVLWSEKGKYQVEEAKRREAEVRAQNAQNAVQSNR